MNSKTINTLMFAFGAAVGSVITWKLVKTKYERIAQEEIDSVKEVFSRREKRLNEKIQEKPDLNKLAASLRNMDQVNYSNVVSNFGYAELEDAEEGGAVVESEPYVIGPEDFGECYEYETVSLTYYADGILADEWDERIEDVDYILGVGSINRFGEYETDALWVRNDNTRSDYEVLYDHRNYGDIHPSAADE